MNENCLVSIVCTTYNHERYVRSALEGFLLQKTNFVFEIIVHDDASTDSTPQIIKEYENRYPNLFRCIYRKENWFSQGKNIWEYLFLNTVKGKYIAICEGDDYWTDPLKLQKQVDLLESNEEIGLVHTDVAICYCSAKRIEQYGNKLYSKNESLYYASPKELIEQILLGRYIIRTATVVLRTTVISNVYNEFDKVLSEHLVMKDIPTWIGCIQNSKIAYIPSVTSVYRYNDTSVTKQADYRKYLLYRLHTLELKMYYLEKENLFVDNIKDSICERYKLLFVIYKSYFDNSYVDIYNCQVTNKKIAFLKKISQNVFSKDLVISLLKGLYFIRVRARKSTYMQRILYWRRVFLAKK